MPLRCITVFLKISGTVVTIEVGCWEQIHFKRACGEVGVYVPLRPSSRTGAPTLEYFFLQTSPTTSLLVRPKPVFLNSFQNTGGTRDDLRRNQSQSLSEY